MCTAKTVQNTHPCQTRTRTKRGGRPAFGCFEGCHTRSSHGDRNTQTSITRRRDLSQCLSDLSQNVYGSPHRVSAQLYKTPNTFKLNENKTRRGDQHSTLGPSHGNRILIMSSGAPSVAQRSFTKSVQITTRNSNPKQKGKMTRSIDKLPALDVLDGIGRLHVFIHPRP